MAASMHLQAFGDWQPIMQSAARRALVSVLIMCATPWPDLRVEPAKIQGGPPGRALLPPLPARRVRAHPQVRRRHPVLWRGAASPFHDATMVE